MTTWWNNSWWRQLQLAPLRLVLLLLLVLEYDEDHRYSLHTHHPTHKYHPPTLPRHHHHHHFHHLRLYPGSSHPGDDHGRPHHTPHDDCFARSRRPTWLRGTILPVVVVACCDRRRQQQQRRYRPRYVVECGDSSSRWLEASWGGSSWWRWWGMVTVEVTLMIQPHPKEKPVFGMTCMWWTSSSYHFVSFVYLPLPLLHGDGFFGFHHHEGDDRNNTLRSCSVDKNNAATGSTNWVGRKRPHTKVWVLRVVLGKIYIT